MVKGMGGEIDFVSSGTRVVVTMEHTAQGGAPKVLKNALCRGLKNNITNPQRSPLRSQMSIQTHSFVLVDVVLVVYIWNVSFQ